ncbi:MAG: general stress protein [Brevundimonas sp.]|uniref:general stress protein n=1 Tax=Brevundimonas sp. TaxID=1871086 RepID=UPI00261AFB55|nr:general stress protein [Brevundimonas sp.]MDI6623509.1 general stress protein [Brevundimonas sp.]
MKVTRSNLGLMTATAVGALMILAGGAAIAAPAPDAPALVLQDHGGGRDTGGHDTGSDHDDSDHADQDSGQQGQQDSRGRTPGETTDRGNRSLDDILRGAAGRGGEDQGGEEDEDSDRPDYAGQRGGPTEHGGRPSDSGSGGDLFGDMYVILRDENGVPILSEAGFVQPIDANGNLIPLDAEGAPIDPSLAIEVELGRLNVGRSPHSVLDNRAEEVVTMLNDADAVSLDAAGRLVVTIDGVSKTIDSPLENLAIYVALMTLGTIPGVTDLPGTEFDHLVDGVLTSADLVSAASFLAGATDKASPLTADDVAYINAVLGINTTQVGDVTYSDVDFSTFTYDRSDAYGDVTALVLVQQPDGSWVPTTVNVYDVVFGGTDYTASGTLSAFTQAAEDARAIVNYIHEYAIPADEVQ